MAETLAQAAARLKAEKEKQKSAVKKVPNAPAPSPTPKVYTLEDKKTAPSKQVEEGAKRITAKGETEVYTAGVWRKAKQ